jgi:hypothetical protein
MTSPVTVVPYAFQAVLGVSKAIGKFGSPQQELDLVDLRVSQINGLGRTMRNVRPGRTTLLSRRP